MGCVWRFKLILHEAWFYETTRKFFLESDMWYDAHRINEFMIRACENRWNENFHRRAFYNFSVIFIVQLINLKKFYESFWYFFTHKHHSSSSYCRLKVPRKLEVNFLIFHKQKSEVKIFDFYCTLLSSFLRYFSTFS